MNSRPIYYSSHGDPKERIYGTLMLFYGMIAISPLLAHVGLRGIYSTVAVVAICAILVGLNRSKIPLKFILLAALLVVGCTVTAVKFADHRYLFLPVFFLVSYLLVNLGKHRAIEVFSTISSWFMLVVLVGATTAFMLARVGVEPLFAFPNPDGRPNYFFYTSLSNSYYGNLMRPSGIFDEPGALSFFICSVAALRHLLRQDDKLTWAILGLGFVTLSLAHLVYVAFHALAQKWSAKRIVCGLLLVLVAVSVAAISGFGTTFKSKLLTRISFDEDSVVVGDNRSWRMHNAFEQIRSNPQVVLFGVDNSCVFDYKKCKEQYPAMGENPLAPLALGGIFISLPYYIFMVTFLASPIFGKRYFVVFGMGLLFAQRPYLMNLGYSLMGVAIAHVFVASVVSSQCILARRKSFAYA